MRKAYFAIRRLFEGAERYFRLLFSRNTPHRFAILFGWFKILWFKRFSPTRKKPIKLLGWRVHYQSLQQLADVYGEIFVDRFYDTVSDKPDPTIIDAGANIGIATLYFKHRYPEAKITCFEPEPDTFETLQQNILENRLEGVALRKSALSAEKGSVELVSNTLLGGDQGQSINRRFRTSLKDKQKLKSLKVPTERLDAYLTSPIDILKMDIEGAEGLVLEAAAKRLHNVASIQMEYHYEAVGNRLENIVGILESHGFHYLISTIGRLENVEGSVAMVYAAREESKVVPARLSNHD